jgi:hypothetical protein
LAQQLRIHTTRREANMSDINEELQIPWTGSDPPRTESGESAGELLAEFPLRFMASASRVLQKADAGV